MSVAASRPRRAFYVVVALLSVVVVFAGFAPTYYLAGAFGGPSLGPLVHAHGAVFTTWMLLFGAQATLVAAHRKAAHRKLGIFGALVAAAMVVLGTVVAIESARRGHTPLPEVPPLAFLALPIGDVAVFAVLAGTGIALRSRRDVHARLMLLATVSILAPAIARLQLDVVQDNNPFAFMIGVSLIVLAAAAYDTMRNRRLHPAFLWGGLLVILGQPARLLLARSEGWLAFAGWLTA